MGMTFFPVHPVPLDFLSRENENRGRMVAALNQLEEISRAFARAQVDWVLVKGVGLALSEYDNPFVRPFCDLDIFVLPAHFGRAVQALLATGYRTGAHPDESLVHWTFTKPQTIPVELHYRFSRESTHPATVLQAFIDHRVVLEGCDFEAHVPCPAHHLAYVLLHAYNHGWQLSGFWVKDVYYLIRNHPEIGPKAMEFFPEPSPVGLSMELAMRYMPELETLVMIPRRQADRLWSLAVASLLHRGRMGKVSSGALRVWTSSNPVLTFLSMLVRVNRS